MKEIVSDKDTEAVEATSNVVNQATSEPHHTSAAVNSAAQDPLINHSTTVGEQIAHDRSPYLVKRLLESNDRNLFNHVKFNLVKQEINRLGLTKPKVLDVGCGVQVSRQYLTELGLHYMYFGVDYEPRFHPDAVVDLMASPVDTQFVMPWEPDVVLMLDVLEHLHEETAILEDILGALRSLVPESCTLIFTLPQMYRLDRFKLSHLHYPEHKVRLQQHEWRTLLETHFDVHSVQGVGYVSVLPYLPMLSKRYQPDNAYGKWFNYLRGHFFEKSFFKPLDLWLSNTLGKTSLFKTISNDILFVVKPKSRF